jgi:cell division septum initiation protein DivIVA
MLSDIKKRMESNYVFDQAGDVVVTQSSDMEWLIAKNTELNKYLKHARDDKKIRVKEIEVLEAKIVELREMLAHLQRQCDSLRKALASKDKEHETRN